MITFSAWPGDEVVIKGSEVVAGWKQHKDKVWVADSCPEPKFYALLFCDGKRMQLIGDGGGNLIESIVGWGGTADVWKGKKGEKLEDMEAGSYFWDRKDKKLYAWLKDGGDPNKHTMEIGVRQEGFYVGVDFIRVYGFKILHAGAGMGGNYGIMEDCDVIDGPWGGLGIGGKFNTIRRCKFNGHGDTGISGAGRGHRFIDCETSYNNFLQISPGWHAGGVKIIALAQDIVMSGHLAAYNEGDGIWFDSGNFSITIVNCVTHHNQGSGIFYEVGERGSIMNNVCYENKGRGVYLSNSSDCQVINNLFWHNGSSGVACTGVSRNWENFGEGENDRLAARNNVVWGNVFVDNCHPDYGFKEPDGRGEPWDTRPELIMPEEWEGNTGNVSDYNIYFRSPKRVLPFWKGWHITLYKDLADWQAKTGYDKHSIIAEPLFVDAKKLDFHAAEGSPAIGFVQPRMGGAYDFDGNLRPTHERPDKKPLRWTAGPFEVLKEAGGR
jgi:parallel beta-helix repeat protein